MNTLISEKWIAYVGPFPFPWGQAGSRRMCGIALSLADAGHHVIVGGGSEFPQQLTPLTESEVSGLVDYIGLSELPNQGFNSLQKFARVFFDWGKNTVKWLDKQHNKPSHVIVYGGSSQYIYHLQPWCKKHKIPLIVDVVEWYDASHMLGGKYGPFNISAKLALRYFYPRCDGIIAISTLLQEYYSKLGVPTVRVPPSLDVSRIAMGDTSSQRSEDFLTIVYAGTPGKKDLLREVVSAIQLTPRGINSIKLLLIGPTAKQVQDLLGSYQIPPFVEILGPIDQAEVASHIRSADFSILIRKPQRYANAGFSTKLVESMANGTPMIANLTSDLGLYLHDSKNAIICASPSVESIASAIGRAMALSPAERIQLRKEARSTAESSFDFRIFSKPLHQFLSNVHPL